MKRNDCPICRHVERKLIDHAISEGRPDSFFADHFAADPGCIEWHRQNCLAPAASEPGAPGQTEAVEDGEQPSRSKLKRRRPATGRHGGGQQTRLRELCDRADQIVRKAANNDKHWRTALSAIAAASRLIALEAKLAERQPTPVPRLAETAEWQQLKARIIRALEPFPEARRALMEALSDEA